MYHVFPGFGLPPQRAFDALDEVVAQQDVSQVPVLVEVSSWRRRLPGVVPVARPAPIGAPAPERYPEWKSYMRSQIDPRFAQFLCDAEETSRINLVIGDELISLAW